MNDLKARKMHKNDLGFVVNLLADDDLGQFRENADEAVNADYIRAFEEISRDVNQYAAIFETALSMCCKDWCNVKGAESYPYDRLGSFCKTHK